MDRGKIEREERVLRVAMEAGHVLLENGAEISRVEETMERITRHYAVESGEFFVLSNGIFTTGGTDHGFARVEHIPVHGARMDRVIAVNQLSREIAAGAVPLGEAEARLAEIRSAPGHGRGLLAVSSAVGASAFCVLFGGSLRDALAVLPVGLLLSFYTQACSPRLSKLVFSLGGGALVSALCLLAHTLGLGENFSQMIIGGIIPLIPGIPFVNGVRDIAGGDYLSGLVRLSDALLVFFGIAGGVWLTLSAFLPLGGGLL